MAEWALTAEVAQWALTAEVADAVNSHTKKMAAAVAVAGVLPPAVTGSNIIKATKTELLILLNLFPNLLFHVFFQ